MAGSGTLCKDRMEPCTSLQTTATDVGIPERAMTAFTASAPSEDRLGI